MRKREAITLALFLCLALSSGVAAVETLMSPLPYDDSPGYAPNPTCFEGASYFDESISVNIEKTRRANANVYTAYVSVKHGSQLRTALAGAPGAKSTNKVSNLAKNNNAVVAINGDYYIDRETGLTIRQGALIRDKQNAQLDTLLIDEGGDFHIVKRDETDMMDFYLSGGMEIINAFSFGPALVVDGIKQEIPEKYGFAPRYKNPRAAIGQLGPLRYALVIVDGRQEDSDGMTMETLAEHMADIGCTQAFNLDGGNSAIMVFAGDIYTDKSTEHERSISDIIYFATYVDPVSWE